MSRCGCGGGRCECVVVAGDNITVEGDGGTTAPYVISTTGAAVTCEQVRPCLSAGPGATYDPATGVVGALVSTDAGNQVTIGTDDGLFVPAGGGDVELAVEDTPTAHMELTGTGAVGDPYTVTADVVLDPAPPGGGTNLLQEGPDGLFVECDTVRTCLSAGDGIEYDPDTGEISAFLSEDPGNQVEFGSDRGLFVPAGGAGGTALAVTDTDTVDLGLTGTGAVGDPYTVTADVVLDPAPPGGGTNLLQEGPDGLFVECGDVRTCLSAGPGATYDPATGVIEARLSGDAGNAVVFGTDDGLFISPAAVDCDDVRPCLSAGDGLAYDPATGEFEVDISADAGNQLALGGDGGLFVPPGGGGGGTVVAVTDSATVDLGLTGDGSAADPYTVTAEVVLDAAPPGGGANLLKAGADGLFVECGDVRTCLTGVNGINYDPGTGQIGVEISPQAGNQVAVAADGGLFVPPGGGGGGTVVAVTDSATVDLGLTGDGSAGAPYTVTAEVVLDAAPPGGGANLLKAGADGLFVECGDVRTCLSAGDGLAYDPATGEFEVEISPQAGNQVAVAADGGLFVPPGAATVETACGLTGDGSAGTPLGAAVQAWPYPCDVNGNAGGVYCDSSGQLRAEPRAKYQYFTTTLNELFPANPVVPATTTTGGTVVATRTLDITNPDPCRPAIAITSVEVDVDFVIPPGGRAGHFVYGDEMYRFENRGSATVSDVHTQTTKVLGNTTIPPGATITVSLDIALGFGLGGATYNRVQSYIRAMVFAL